MARRKNTEAEAPTTEEAPVSTDTSTATEAEPQAEAKPEAEIDLTAFNAAVESAVAEADTSTGEIPSASLDSVVAEYRKLDGTKAKNAAKKALNEGMKNAMNESDIVKARSFLTLTESMTAGSPAKAAERAPADPTEAFVQKAVVLELAQALLVPGEGVADDWRERADKLVSESSASAEQYMAWVQDESEDKGDEPDVPTIVKNAVKLALGKSARVTGGARQGSTFTGERRDIGKHILQAFADQPVGTFLTVAEIRKFVSDEYGTNSPSAGAISARLFPQGDASKCTLISEGIEPDTNEKGNKGARKTA